MKAVFCLVFWCFAIISQVPSRLPARFQHLSQDLIETRRANECPRTNMSSRRSVDRAPARCSGGHGFNSCRGLRIFLCPMLVSCWLIHLHMPIFFVNYYSAASCRYGIYIDGFKVSKIVERSCWFPLKSLANFSGSKVRSLDRNVSKQRERNVLLVFPDVSGGGRLRDEHKKASAYEATPLPYVHLLYRKFLLWSIDSCQNKVSTDQYHVNIAWAQVWSPDTGFRFVRVLKPGFHSEGAEGGT